MTSWRMCSAMIIPNDYTSFTTGKDMKASAAGDREFKQYTNKSTIMGHGALV